MKYFKTIIYYYNLLFVVCVFGLGIYTNNIITHPKLLIIILPLLIFFVGFFLIKLKIIKTSQQSAFWLFVSLLIFFNLFSTSILLFSNLYFSRTSIDVIVSLCYLPIPLYFLITIVGWYQKVLKTNKIQVSLARQKNDTLAPASKVDYDRRRFLKILGGTGVSIFLMSLLNPKQAGAAFFGSVPGPGTISIKDASGVKINPSEKQPTDGYKISQVDDTSYPYYYGYVNSTGAWYIMSEDINSNYRYTRGDSGFATNWTNRASLTYGYFDSVF